MQTHMPPPTSRRLARALLASLAAVATTALAGGEANAEGLHAGARAELSVSVSVVRACTVATPALVVVGDELASDGTATRVADDVALRCSGGAEGAVHVGPPSLQSVLHTQLAHELAAPSLQGASEPVVVTVLF
jgi:hypothetical protein